MTALYMDGFDHYGTGSASATNMVAGSWAYSNFATCATPPWGAARTGTYCLRNSGASPSGNRYALPTPGAHFFVSFGYAVDTLGIVGQPWPVMFRTNSLGIVLYLNVLPNGQIQVLNSASTQIAITNGPAITAESWNLFEMEINTGSNLFTLRINDATGAATPIISVTDASITGTIALVGFLEGSSGGVANIDDVFIRDGSGSVNNGFLGDRRVATVFADADTTTQGWTPTFYSKLGAGILNNTGTNACIYTTTSTSLDIGASAFTLETFVRFESLPVGAGVKSVIFSRWDEINNQRSYQLFLGSTALNSGSLCWQTSTDGTASTVAQPIVYPWTPLLDTWYHIAIVRAAGQDLLFVNGQQLGLPIADSRTYFAGTSPWSIGAEVENYSSPFVAGTFLNGWFDETRFTNGYARYTANFTPTTVEFPRGSPADPQWADVAYIAGYDTIIQDESSYARTMQTNNAVQFTTNDGSSFGNWSAVGKAVPDDNTYISAPFIAATSILTLTVNPSNGNSVRVGTTNGSTAATYTFKTTLATSFDVLIDTNIQNTLQNLYNAINAGPGSGTKYGTGTTANFDVNATQLPAGQMMVTANTAGTGGNSIVSTSSGITGGWTGGTLSGGLNIPGPSNFKLQRLPPTTTIVSAVQVTTRSFKSDAGTGTINTALVGALGGVSTGPTHALTISPNYYNDIYQTDPDTSGPISPTTITNGAIQINRDT
jgi:hypothetical protein